MANHSYNYSSSYGGAGVSSSSYSDHLSSATERYSDASLIGSSRYLSLDPGSAKFSTFDRGTPLYSSQNEVLRFSSAEIPGIGAAGSFPTSRIAGGFGASGTSWSGLNGFGAAPAVDPALVPSMKRSAEALYHQTILGTHNTIGQSEALFSANSLDKRPRLEIASNLPIYPERPGEKDCAHYMMTRTCRFGINCKYDHPRWVPEGGIPDWKEIPLMHHTESLPERPGEPDCPFYMKTQRCKFGSRCKFNHPTGIIDASADGLAEGVPIPSAGQELAVKDNGAAGGDLKPANTFVPFTPSLLNNSKGLPIRPGETDCPFYLKTGSCKYGATCRYNHPERTSIIPPVAAALGQAIVPSTGTNLPVGVFNPAANFLQNIDPRLTQTTIAMGPIMYPQRPGELECDFYMKTGQCKFGERCKFHHPISRFAPTAEQNVKLTLAGLPRREGTVACPYYMKTGACKYGVNCRYDHPPPGEAVALATVLGSAAGAFAAVGGEEVDAAAEVQD